MNFFSKILGTKSPCCSCAAVQGQGQRGMQQDAYLMLGFNEAGAGCEKAVLALVADGMGGAEKGEVASELAVKHMAEAFRSMDMQGDIAVQLNEAVYTLNKRVFEVLGGRGGSTLAVCIVYGRQLYFSSIGDSGIYLLRAGQLSRLNIEDNAANLAYSSLICRGCTNPAEAEAGPNPYALSRFIGMPALDGTDSLLKPLALEAGDRLLICSDGIDGSVPEELLIYCLGAKTPEKACNLLEKEIKEAALPYQDNYTALVLKLGD